MDQGEGGQVHAGMCFGGGFPGRRRSAGIFRASVPGLCVALFFTRRGSEDNAGAGGQRLEDRSRVLWRCGCSQS